MENINLLPELESASVAINALDDSPDLRSPHLYNALSLLHESLGKDSWVGLYVEKNGRLLLGPFQGTPACEKIAFGKGVVGACHAQKKTIAVEDVMKFPGYICCDAKAASEICIPLFRDGATYAILDIDLPYIHAFRDEEIMQFEKIARDLQRLF
ncbi:MAG: GAF domain-containing protein [Bacilli bacterium]|nr:GAF domain-containing protein [Bacilli bacterium]